MPPSFNNFTTKAKEVIRRAHELAIERGQNQVSPLHLMGALLTQEESLVHAILERLGTDKGIEPHYSEIERIEEYKRNI